MSKQKVVGIIAEDISDVNTLKVLIKRITNKNVTTKHFVGRGCGKIISKCLNWSVLLYKDCDLLIILHDADNNSAIDIYTKISTKLKNCPFSTRLISIPVQEVEAWLLSDAEGLKNALNLSTIPKIRNNIQQINSPKEYLELIIKQSSLGKKQYINTKHNEVIAKKLRISDIHKKCASFRPLHDFVVENIN